MKQFLTGVYLTVRELTAAAVTKFLTKKEFPEKGTTEDNKQNVIAGTAKVLGTVIGWGLVGLAGLSAVMGGIGVLGALVGAYSFLVPLKAVGVAALYAAGSACSFGVRNGFKNAVLMKKQHQAESGLPRFDASNNGPTNLQNGAANTFNNSAQPGQNNQQQQTRPGQNNVQNLQP